MNTRDLKTSRVKKVALVGNSGTGKTSSLATLSGKTLILNFDLRGVEVLADYDIYYEDFTSRKEDRNYHIWLKFEKFLLEWISISDGVLKYNGDVIDNIVVDSLTTMQDCIMSYGMWEPVTKKWKRSVIGIHNQPLQGDYGFVIDTTDWVLNTLLSLPITVVVTAHIQLFEVQLTQEVIQAPLIIGRKAPSRFGIPFSEVYYSTVINGEYVWRTKPFSNVGFPKTRIKNLPEQIPQDFDLLLKYRLGKEEV